MIAAWPAADRADIDAPARRLEPAARRRIHTFIATSDLHLERKLRITREQCLEAAVDCGRAARAATPTTWSSRPRMRRAATSTSCAASSRR